MWGNEEELEKSEMKEQEVQGKVKNIKAETSTT